MSSYGAEAKKPNGKEFEPVLILDDYYGKHRYGVKFGDGEVYPEEECEIAHE